MHNSYITSREKNVFIEIIIQIFQMRACVAGPISRCIHKKKYIFEEELMSHL